MGWLFDLMRACDPPHRSYGALARAALGHRDWPPDTRMQARSLAALFSKLDRDQETEWLLYRDGVQRVLAQVLGCALAEVRGAVDRPDSASRQLRLDDIRYARPIDLIDEPLCPGVPAEVALPARWGRVWWHAPSGSGRSLVGAWLAARQLARHATGTDSIPGSGAVFLELQAPGEVPMRSAPICVAAPFLPPPDAGFEVVFSPPVEAYLDDLVSWVDRRLSQRGHFDVGFAREWLRSVPLADSLGSVLGLCGLIDEVGPRVLREQGTARATRRFFELRISEWSERSDASWLRRSGFEALIGMVKRILTDSDDPYLAPRSVGVWLDLVPVEHRHGPDLDWMRAGLIEPTSPVRPTDVDRAARRLPPGAYRLVRALRQARLLVPAAGDGGLQIRPQWFARSVVLEAERQLVDGSPAEWGEALLRPHAAGRIETGVTGRLMQGDGALIDDVVDLEADESPAAVAALEATFRGTGAALLAGVDLPGDLIEAVWNETLRVMLELPGRLPQPRIAPPDPEQRQAQHSAFLVAALAISEQLPAHAGVRHPLLRPWSTTEPPEGLARCYDCILEAALRPDCVWSRSAFALAGRVRALIGGVGHPLEQPAAILEEAEHGVLEWPTVRGMSSVALQALLRLAEARSVAVSVLGQAIWDAWARDGGTDPDIWQLAPVVWPFLSVSAVPFAIRSPERPPLAGLADERWPDVLPLLVNDAELWQSLPDQFLKDAVLASRVTDRRALAVLWSRAPDLVTAALGAGIDAGHHELLQAVPDAALPGVLSVLRDRLPDASSGLLTAVRDLLHDRVARRGPHWIEVYALLAAVERDVAAASRVTRR